VDGPDPSYVVVVERPLTLFHSSEKSCTFSSFSLAVCGAEVTGIDSLLLLDQEIAFFF